MDSSSLVLWWFWGLNNRVKMIIVTRYPTAAVTTTIDFKISKCYSLSIPISSLSEIINISKHQNVILYLLRLSLS